MPPPANAARRWVVPAMLLALAPKCALCLVGYAGLATALGVTGPQLCGAPAASATPWHWLIGIGLALGSIARRLW